MGVTRRVYGLDLMRSIAIAFVVVAHGLVFLYPTTKYIGYLGNLGGVGVELFFVLSGFLIGGIILDYGESFRRPKVVVNFMMRRWFRTLPNYYLFLALNLLLLIFVPRVNFPGFFETLKFVTFTQNLAWRSPPFFRESWSLSIEEWFYLSFAVLLTLSLRIFSSLKPAVLMTFGLMFLGPIVLRILYLDEGGNWRNDYRMTVVLRLDALMYGVAAAYLKIKCQNLWNSLRVLGVCSGVLILVPAYVSMFLFDLDESGFSKIALLSFFSLGFALTLPYFSSLAESRNAALGTAIEKISKWSYSMYLCNLIFMHTYLDAFKAWYTVSSIGGIVVFGVYVLSVLATSAFVYRFFEKPMFRLRERFAPAVRA